MARTIGLKGKRASKKKHNFTMKRSLETDQQKTQISNEEIVQHFYTKVANSTYLWQCKCGAQRKQVNKTGYTNLMNHLSNAHPGFEKDVRESMKSGLQLDKYFYPSEKASQIYGWLDWIISDG